MATFRRYRYVRMLHPKNGTPNTEDLVELIFHKFKPRLNFIVRQTEGNVYKNAEANEIGETMLLVTNFLGNRPEYDDHVILSFHRGRWYQVNDTPWHCHLCVPIEQYCREAKQKFGDDYVWEIQNRFQETLQKYKEKKRKLVEYVDSLQSIPFNITAYENDGFGLVWMIPHPRIGVYSQKPQELHLLYNFMAGVNEQMEKYLSSKDKFFENFGCSFCLFVSGKNQTKTTPRRFKVLNETGTDVKRTELVGYIQMNEQLYYRLLPDENHQQKWFTEFERHEYVDIT
ncbi:unnamed protein product [Adineta steineri]|uniref:Uncharacterized protein n=1 Tax=Adineta steineri TaxID=433720 RepID=A0A819HDJ4_9BILA|nr:unnamed protein product [Adineta steineri]